MSKKNPVCNTIPCVCIAVHAKVGRRKICKTGVRTSYICKHVTFCAKRNVTTASDTAPVAIDGIAVICD